MREVPTAQRNGSRSYRRWAAGAALVAAGILCSATSASASAGGQVLRASAGPALSVPAVVRPAPNPVTNPAPMATPAPMAAPAHMTTTGDMTTTEEMASPAQTETPATAAIPLALGVLVFAFLVLQWLVDHRGPRSVAPGRREDDTVGFE